MTTADQAAYRSFYCSQCLAIGRDYGFPWRWFVSFDATTFGILISAQSGEVPATATNWCLLHPVRQEIVRPGLPIPKLMAAMALMTVWFKLVDKKNEGHSAWPARFLALGRQPLERSIAVLEQYGFARDLAAATMAGQQSAETGDLADWRRLSALTAELFSQLLGLTATIAGREENRRPLMTIGRNMGELVYWTDATADMAEDLAGRRFNPWLNQARLRDGLLDPLSAHIAGCVDSIRLELPRLQLVRHQQLVRNLFEGFRRNLVKEINRGWRQWHKTIDNACEIAADALPHPAMLATLRLATAGTHGADGQGGGCQSRALMVGDPSGTGPGDRPDPAAAASADRPGDGPESDPPPNQPKKKPKAKPESSFCWFCDSCCCDLDCGGCCDCGNIDCKCCDCSGCDCNCNCCDCST